MSRSLARVRRTLEAAGLDTAIVEMPGSTRTAAEAATAAGCAPDQIARSIVFRGEADGHVVLFLTAGGNRVDPALAGEPLGKADAALIRAETGFCHRRCRPGRSPLAAAQPDRPAIGRFRTGPGRRRHPAPCLRHRAGRAATALRRRTRGFHPLIPREKRTSPVSWGEYSGGPGAAPPVSFRAPSGSGGNASG